MAVKETKGEQNVMFEEEQRKFQCEVAMQHDKKEKQCKNCERMMSDMRKVGIRWLYLQLYKKATQGQRLPNITELTDTLGKVLEGTYSELGGCNYCGVDIEEVIERTLLPMNSLSTSTFQRLPYANFANCENGNECTTMQQSLKESRYKKPVNNENQRNIKDKEEKYPAATFFARAALKLDLHSKNKLRRSKKIGMMELQRGKEAFLTNFSDLIMRNPPQAPTNLFKTGTVRRGDGHGKVRLILRLADKRNRDDSCLSVDRKKKQVLLRESIFTTDNSPKLEKGPRLYSFDNVYEKDTPQLDMCSGILVDLLHSVVNGNDACLLTYGYPKLGNSAILVGKDDSPIKIGIIPCAISWLYQLIDDRKLRTGARFSVRVSAVEIVGKSENMKDLLGEQGYGSMNSMATSPSLYLPRERASSIQLSDFTELRASTAEKAAIYFDAAVNSRTTSDPNIGNFDEGFDYPNERRNSNMIFTLHVYQYMIDKVGTGELHGGRSRFHLIDLSGCCRNKRIRDSAQGTWLPMSALGNVIASLSNGTKHIPHRDSKLTTLLREAMGSLSVRISIIANVSQNPKHYLETLSTLQLTSRIHRSRKKKSSLSSASSSGGESSCDERKKHRRRCKPVTPLHRTDTCQSDNVCESDFASTSAAEESCDTVIYKGPSGDVLSDRELTDFEHPPEAPITGSRIVTQNTNDYTVLVNKEKEKECWVKKSKTAEGNKPIIVNISSESFSELTLERKSSSKSCAREQSMYKTSKENIDNRSYCMTLDNDILNNQFNKLIGTAHKQSQCVSTNSSPCKKIRNYNDASIKRSSSLNRLSMTRLEVFDDRGCPSHYKSNDTLSSVGTIENFERDLVTKIAERFALEDEFSYSPTSDSNISSWKDFHYVEQKINEKETDLAPLESSEFYIDDDLYGICGKLDDGNRENMSQNEKHTSASLPLLVESEQRNNNVLNCNNCFGECKCDENLTSPVYSHQVHQVGERFLYQYDSEEDTDEKTDNYLRNRYYRKRNSFSSCESHLGTSPKNLHQCQASEGVSSGYESMRCESNANINSTNDNTATGKDCILSHATQIESFQEEIDASENPVDNLTIEEESISRFNQKEKYRTHIKELIEERQDLKAQLHQTLKKLVLNRVPLPSIDDHLRQISVNSKDTSKILKRENRIMERKVKVCKSHLQLVSCFDNPTNTVTKTITMMSPLLSPRKRYQYQKLPDKGGRLPNSAPTVRKCYKVTSV